MSRTDVEALRRFHDDMAAWRHDLHAHPEIGFNEHRTAARVAFLLESFGVAVHRGVGGTGVVGVLRNGDGRRRVGLRADMDALPIQEATGAAHASLTPGVMHACGHDGHTAMLLGAARHLAETRRFSGTVHFIFQPAEEGLGGALAMLGDGLLDRFPCDALFGLHNAPGIDVGRFAIRSGPMMAGGAFFDLTVSGRGSHGARPDLGADPVLAAAHLTAALQAVVARAVKPTDPAVVSVTAVQAGDAYNVIPDQAALRGTARAFSDRTMALIEATIRRTADGVAAGLGCTASLDFRRIFAPLVNDPAATALYADAAAALVGQDAVNRAREPVTGSEDFSFMLERVPGAYIHLGNGPTAPVHNPAYDFSDAALPLGAAVMAAVAEAELARP